MSLDNTSHPGRPGPDELVPSRYALRVGGASATFSTSRARGLPNIPSLIIYI
jgi:hypothetical protein